eukprot:scaffold116219_cov60-Phaeocystis_antarctica.AAC.1
MAPLPAVDLPPPAVPLLATVLAAAAAAAADFAVAAAAAAAAVAAAPAAAAVVAAELEAGAAELVAEGFPDDVRHVIVVLEVEGKAFLVLHVHALRVLAIRVLELESGRLTLGVEKVFRSLRAQVGIFDGVGHVKLFRLFAVGDPGRDHDRRPHCRHRLFLRSRLRPSVGLCPRVRHRRAVCLRRHLHSQHLFTHPCHRRRHRCRPCRLRRIWRLSRRCRSCRSCRSCRRCLLPLALLTRLQFLLAPEFKVVVRVRARARARARAQFRGRVGIRVQGFVILTPSASSPPASPPAASSPPRGWLSWHLALSACKRCRATVVPGTARAAEGLCNQGRDTAAAAPRTAHGALGCIHGSG